MKELLLNNYEWIFSGIGLFILSLIVGYFSKKEKINTKFEVNYDFDAKEASSQIDTAAPFQRKEIKKSFIGQYVCWEIHYYSLHSKIGNKVTIMSQYKGNYPWVNFRLDLKNYPFFKIAKEGDIFEITGRIINADDNEFELKIHKIIKKETTEKTK